jgi:proteasome lid subunit RPN8/RPN11
MLKLHEEIHQAIRQHGIDSYPNEGCGLLLGHNENGHNRAVAIFPVPNTWRVEAEKPQRFAIGPEDMLAAEMEALDQGLDVIGVFHSHPNHPPIASPRDLAWAAWSGYSYLITEIRQRQAAASRSWQLLPDRSGFVEEPIEIAETT